MRETTSSYAGTSRSTSTKSVFISFCFFTSSISLFKCSSCISSLIWIHNWIYTKWRLFLSLPQILWSTSISIDTSWSHTTWRVGQHFVRLANGWINLFHGIISKLIQVGLLPMSIMWVNTPVIQFINKHVLIICSIKCWENTAITSQVIN